MAEFKVVVADISRCPKPIWAAEHYRADGSCLCLEPSEETDVSDDTTAEAGGVAGGPHVGKFLDLSTDHLPKAYRGGLLNSADGVTSYGFAEEVGGGELLWVPADPDKHAEDYEEDDGVPQEILVIQRYAREHGCDYVLFSDDAARDRNLPHWEG